MSIIRKWAFARAEVYDENGVAWIAEARAGTGTWVLRDPDAVGDPDGQIPVDDLGREQQPRGLRGAMFPFTDQESMLLLMTTEQREALGMSDATYQAINVELGLDQRRRDGLADRSSEARVIEELRRRVEALERGDGS